MNCRCCDRKQPMIDLRSDTVTLPTEEMREAMRRAELGDDSREGDPTVRRLEEAAAAMHRQGGRDVRRQRHDVEPGRAARPYRARRRGAARRRLAHHAQRDGRHRVARRAVLPPDPVDARRARPRRDRRASDRAAQRQQARDRAGLRRDHAQQRRRRGPAARLSWRSCAR